MLSSTNAVEKHAKEEDNSKERDLDTLQGALKSWIRHTHGRTVHNLPFYGSLRPPKKRIEL